MTTIFCVNDVEDIYMVDRIKEVLPNTSISRLQILDNQMKDLHYEDSQIIITQNCELVLIAQVMVAKGEKKPHEIHIIEVEKGKVKDYPLAEDGTFRGGSPRMLKFGTELKLELAKINKAKD